MNILIACAAAYLLGSVPAGKIAARIAGVDIQKRGSGNIGFANVLRILGWKYALPTLAVDVAKGFFATLLGWRLTGDLTGAFLVGYFAIIGHCFPVWLKFRGGKGVAAGLGVVLCLAPIAGVLAMIFYGTTRFLLKMKSSMASFIGLFTVMISWTIAMPNLWWFSIILLFTAGFTLRKNIRGTVPDYG